MKNGSFYSPLEKSIKKLLDHNNTKFDSIQHKSHCPKLMVSAAISEPTETFDGKVGILVHGEVIPAKRNSVNRMRGTPIMTSKNVDSKGFFSSQTKINDDVKQTGYKT
jgi:hypothetical protein